MSGQLPVSSERELDAWIASSIFMFYVHREGKALYISTFKEPDWHAKSGLLPHYNTDPAAAMQVLEKCRCVESVHIMPPSPDHNCEIWGGGSRAKADTLPLAICKFAKSLFSR